MKKEILIFAVFVLISFIFWGSITLSEEYTVSLSLPVRVALPEKIAVEGDIPENIDIKVRTTGWEIIKIKYFQNPKIEISVNEPIDNINFYTNTITNEQVGLSSNAKIVSFRPEVIRLSFNFSTEKKVKISPRLIFSLKDGYEIIPPIIVEPESIIIKGSRKVLSQIDSIPTQTIYLSELSEFTTIQTSVVDTLKNLLNYERVPVKITLDVQQIVDREFDKIPVELINIPKGKDLILLPSYIDVKLRGGIKVLGFLSPDTLKAFIDYKKYSFENSEDIIPEFNLPFGVRVLDYYPKQFKIIVRRWNVYKFWRNRCLGQINSN